MPSTPISTPQRILILHTSLSSGVLPFLTSLTGSAPKPHSHSPTSSRSPHPIQTTAGLSHTLHLSNPYYTADIPIWIDETSDPDAWARDFSSEDAGDVVRAVGAWIVVFRLPMARLYRGSGIGSGSGEESEGKGTMDEVKQLMQAVRSVIRAAYNDNEDEWDGVCLAVGWPEDHSSSIIVSRDSEPGDLDRRKTKVDEEAEREEWEDLCFDNRFEFVDCRLKESRNEVGELSGMERVREALEANEWEGGGARDVEKELFEDLVDGSEDGFGELVGGELMDEELLCEDNEVERRSGGLRTGVVHCLDADGDGMNGSDGAQQVEELERMVGRMIAVKEMTAHLPKEQRKKAAARAVNDIMKTM